MLRCRSEARVLATCLRWCAALATLCGCADSDCVRNTDCDYGEQCSLGRCVLPPSGTDGGIGDAAKPIDSGLVSGNGGLDDVIQYPVLPDYGDAGFGAPRLDEAADAAMDGSMDSALDAGMDAGMDPAMDAGTDAGMDAGMDAATDAGPDGGTDAGPGDTDAGMDADAG